MVYKITKGSTSPKDYQVNEQEELFFSELSKVIKSGRITLIRMSNGALSVNYNGYPVGKIKLQGRKYWMQILKDLDSSTCVDGSVDLFIERISDWKRYIDRYCN